ncbi:MAG: hypothetical protein IV100_15700 [Myxococcales bacterium]|nr:hypothetical protein [Myxococcales bacterium]
MSVGLAYFGVFLLAPLTTLVTVLLAAGLVLATVTALLGSGSWSASWRLWALPLVALLVLIRRAIGRSWRRLRARGVVDLDALASGPPRPDVGPKANGLGILRRAGLPTLPGFVVTRRAFEGLTGPALRRRLEEALRQMARDASAVPGIVPDTAVVRSSFEGEDGAASSGAGRYATLRDVPMRPDAVRDAIAAVFGQAGPARGGVIVQPRVEGIFGVVATVDPRTGFLETALVQRHHLEGPEAHEVNVTTEVVSRLVGHTEPAVVALDALQAERGPHAVPMEAEVFWPDDGEGRPLFLQLRPLHGVPVAATFVNGGPAALPPVPLSPPSRRRYLGQSLTGAPITPDDAARTLAARLTEVVSPLGYVPYDAADVREYAGRFYVRHRPHDRPRGVGLVRYALALVGVRRRPRDPVLAGAHLALLADAWWSILLASAPALGDDARRALLAGVQPLGRPNTPEELLDPGYLLDWPPWAPPKGVPIPVTGPIGHRLWVRFCIWRFRSLLLARFEARERVLAESRRVRESMDGAALTGDGIARWRAECMAPAPSVLHEPSQATSTTPDEAELRYGPAVRGAVVGILCFDDPDPVIVGPTGVEPHPGPDRPLILYVADARPGHAAHFPRIAGLIVERGGPLSHLVLLAREAGIPTVIGPRPSFPAGALVTLDGGSGALARIDATRVARTRASEPSP